MAAALRFPRGAGFCWCHAKHHRQQLRPQENPAKPLPAFDHEMAGFLEQAGLTLLGWQSCPRVGHSSVMSCYHCRQGALDPSPGMAAILTSLATGCHGVQQADREDLSRLGRVLESWTGYSQ